MFDIEYQTTNFHPLTPSPCHSFTVPLWYNRWQMGNAPYSFHGRRHAAMFTFFTQADPEFGRISITTTIVWLAALGLSVYFLTRWQTSNAARRRFWRHWAIGTLVVGGLTIVALALNLFKVPFFNIRAWIYLFSVATLAYWAWAAYSYFTKLPADAAAAARTARGVRPNQRTGAQNEGRAKVYTTTKAQQARPAKQANAAKQTNGTAASQPAREPRAVATTKRRESRRDRKRRSR